MTQRLTKFGIIATVAAFAATATLLMLPYAAEAAPAYVNGAGAQDDNNDTGFAIAAQNHTSGNLLVVMIKYEGGAGTTVTVSDTAGNIYTPLTRRDAAANDMHVQMFYAENVTGHASNVVTFTLTAARQFKRGVVHQYSGMATSGAFDQENWGSGSSGTAISTGNITTTQNDEVLVAFAGEYTAQTYTAGTNFTERIDVGALFPGTGSASEDRIVTSAGTYNATMTQANSADWALIVSSFKAASAMQALSKPPNNLGLVGYWSFNEGTGTVATDFSGNGKHGTISGSTWTNGKRSKALSFDGANDYVEPPGTLGLSAVRTYSAWIYPRTAGESNFGMIVATSEGAALTGNNLNMCSGDPTECSGLSNTLEYYQYNSGDAGAWHTPANSITLNAWNHVAVVHDSSSDTNDPVMYINGRSVTVTQALTPSGPGTPDESFHIGSNDETGAFAFDGVIDEVRAYNRALSATEVAALARAGVVRFTSNSKTLTQGTSLDSGLVGLWTFDGKDTTWTSETAGTTRDGSGNNETGTLTSMERSIAPTIGKLGQAFDLDGTNDFIDSGNIGNVQSVAFWIKADVTTSREIIALTAAAQVELDGSSQVTATNFTSPTVYVDGVVAATIDSGWRHVVVTTGTAVNATAVQLGQAGATFFDGRLDDVRLYNRALTAAEVKQLYNLGKAKITQ